MMFDKTCFVSFRWQKKTASAFNKIFTALDAIRSYIVSWDEVNKVTICSCFK